MTAGGIILLNINPLYDLDPKEFLGARTDKVQQVLFEENGLVVKDLVKDRQTRHEISAQALDRIYKSAHTIIIPDSMFSPNSFLMENEDFLRHGLSPLIRFYEGGGTVMVVCVEGVFSIGDLLSKSFGTKWKLGKVESTSCVPSETGRRILAGIDLPDVYLGGKVHFMKAPPDEGLYQFKMCANKESFWEDWGLDPDDEDDDAEGAWERYVKDNSHQYAICVHRGEGGRRVIWNGDRGQNAPMKGVFLKLLELDTDVMPGAKSVDSASKAATADAEKPAKSPAHAKSSPLGSATTTQNETRESGMNWTLATIMAVLAFMIYLYFLPEE